MKHFRLLLAAVLASVCSIQVIRAEVTAPTFPEAATLESGKTYYLYNVGSGQFIYIGGTTVYAYTESRSPLVVTETDDGCYTLYVGGTNYYMISSGTNVESSTSSSATYLSYRKFRIEPTDGGYTIRHNYDYNEAYYVGNASGNQKLYANFTAGNIVWQFYDEEGANAIIRYRAKKALYDALEGAEGYEFAITAYEDIYEDENSTNEELIAATDQLNQKIQITQQVSSDWTEYPVFMEGGWGISSKIEKCIYSSVAYGNTKTCKATVIVDSDATLVYQYYIDSQSNLDWGTSSRYAGSMQVYLDGEEVQNINFREGWDKRQNFFVEMSPGRHVIEWKGTGQSSAGRTYFTLCNIGVQKTPTITVNLTQAGSLGTEILYNVDHVKDVRKLVIKGNMNDEDWTRVNMMTGLFELDLSDAHIDNIPAVNPGSFFHKVTLPTSLKTLETNAFKDTNLEEITFPETLTSIGARAFSGTRIKSAVIPASVTTIGMDAFAYNQSLLQASYPAAATAMPRACFYCCPSLKDVTIPEGVKSIGIYAFQESYRVNTRIPSTVTSIGEYAFYQTDIDTVVISNNAVIGYDAFRDCDKLKYVSIGKNCSVAYDSFKECDKLEKVVIGEDSNLGNGTFYQCPMLKEIEFPSTFYSIAVSDILCNCSGLGKGGIVTFKSPTMVNGEYYKSFFQGCGSDITIRVPFYLVNTYKLDPYWYNYNIEGFSTADITDWAIRAPLTFYSQDRFEGTPNVTIYTWGSWTINGTLAQDVNVLHTNYSSQQYGSGMSASAKLISNCDNVSIKGRYWHSYYAYSGRWNFISLPFDIRVSDIRCDNNAHFAIRYYDGANRAANGTGGNWKNYADDAVIPAGTGFILQTSANCWVSFYALDNASKQNVVSNRTFTKALDANASEQSSNKGWNLVGNPWLAYYNIHKLNFTGAITVYDGYNRKYTAYSIIDDDYAILPNQAFFVQCPDEVSEIAFPVDGRQLTDVIESQNGVKAQTAQTPTRWLVDIELNDGEQTDRTRFVLNEEATMGYEMSRDASKFFEDGTACPQLYTMEQGEALAINERPMGDGMVQIGIRVAQSGSYTFSAPRNQFEHIWLYDRENGNQVDLAAESYTFTAEAGVDEARFELRINSRDVATGMEAVQTATNATKRAIYTLDGRHVATSAQKGVYIVDGKKVVIQ